MKLGDYVHARTVEQQYERAGVFALDLGDGTIEVYGPAGIYVCHKDAALVIPDENIFSSIDAEHVTRVRKKLGL